MEFAPSQTIIGDYVILENEILGFGSFGEVLKGYRKSNKKDLVAVKRIRLGDYQVYERENIQKMITNEIQSLRDLEHPNIVSLYDEESDANNNVYLIMEFCRSGDLTKFIKSEQKLSLKEIMRYFRQIVKAMIYANQENYIHRDIKPANILISNRKAKIADFGLARLVEDPNIKAKMTAHGTPLYKAPEVFNNNKFSSKCDVWSSGILLYEMIYGRTPWPATGSEFALQKLIKENPVKFDSKVAGVDSDLRDLIRKMLKIDQNERISFEDVLKHKAMKKSYEDSDSENETKDPPRFLEYLRNRADFFARLSKDIKINKMSMDLKRDLGGRLTVLFKKCEVITMERIRRIVSGVETDVKEIPSKLRGKAALKHFRKIYEEKNNKTLESFQRYFDESYKSKSKSFNRIILNEDYEAGDDFEEEYNKVLKEYLDCFCDSYDREEWDIMEDEEVDDGALRTILKLMRVRKFKYITKRFKFDRKSQSEDPFVGFEAELDDLKRKKLVKKIVGYKKRFLGEISEF